MHARALVAACLAAALPLTAFAQTVRRLPTMQPHTIQPITRIPASRAPGVRPARFRPVPQGPHTFYGKIVGLNGNAVVIQTRGNRLVNVDATSVLAGDQYSAPLFVGKLVDIDGTQPATGAFVAAHITRLANLNNLRNDH